MTSSLTGRSALLLSLLVLLSTAFAACAPAAAGATGTLPPTSTAADEGRGDAVDPDQPVTGGPGQPAGPPNGDGALQVKPEPGIVNPLPHAWDHISVAPDGRTITIYYWGGVEECNGLAGVDVQRDEEGLLKVTVLEGRRGELAPDAMCIEIALLKAVTVELDEPLVAAAD
jgi:hypothetical protein